MRTDTLTALFILALLAATGCETTATTESPYDDGDLLEQVEQLRLELEELQSAVDAIEEPVPVEAAQAMVVHEAPSAVVACEVDWPYGDTARWWYGATGVMVEQPDMVLVSWPGVYDSLQPVSYDVIDSCDDVFLDGTQPHDPPDVLILDGEVLLLGGDADQSVYWLQPPLVAVIPGQWSDES